VTVTLFFLGLPIALAGWWVTWQQMQMARVKLHWERYETRYKVYDAARNLLVDALNNDMVSQKDHLIPYWRATADALFLFDDEIAAYLSTIDRQVIVMDSIRRRLGGTPGNPDLSERLLQEQIAVNEQLGLVRDKFRRFLQEPPIRTFPLWVERSWRWVCRQGCRLIGCARRSVGKA
jgi:hypothetical protein